MSKMPKFKTRQSSDQTPECPKANMLKTPAVWSSDPVVGKTCIPEAPSVLPGTIDPAASSERDPGPYPECGFRKIRPDFKEKNRDGGPRAHFP